MTLRKLSLTLVCSTLCFAQVTIPDGTKMRVRLDQLMTSATAEVGQTVELTLAEEVRINDVVAINEGARVTGTVTEAVPKKRMGRAGKLDFSIDRVAAADGQWVPIRYTLQRKSGQSHALRTGIITAGVAVVFWPAAPVMLLMKGKDITINKGVSFDIYTDSPHVLAMSPAGTGPTPQQSTTSVPALTPTPTQSSASVPGLTSSFAAVATPPTAASGGASVTITAICAQRRHRS